MKKALLIAVSALALSACVSVSRPFRESPSLTTHEPGKTKSENILQMFRHPRRGGSDAGEDTWTYLDYKFGPFIQSHAEDLYVHFNKDKTVRSYTFNTDFPGLPGAR
jgi:hypothetical protein